MSAFCSYPFYVTMVVMRLTAMLLKFLPANLRPEVPAMKLHFLPPVPCKSFANMLITSNFKRVWTKP